MLPFMTVRCEQLLDALNQKQKEEAVAPSNTSLGKAGKWTILVYLDADNNLEGAGVGDVQEMFNRYSNFGGNKVYVLMDRIANYSANGISLSGCGGDGTFDAETTAYMFEITSATSATCTGSVPTGFTQNSEPNMGSGTLLQNFITWGLAQAATDASDYIYLDIWDHGAGWGGAAYGGKAVAWDDTDGHDALTIDEIRNALTAAYQTSSRRVTILGFDACYMGTVENIFSFKDLVSILIGSEEVEPGNGWDYVWIPNGSASPADVATRVVTTYETFYANQTGSNVTLAAYDLSKVASLQSAIDTFVGAIGGASSSQVITARSQVQNYNNNFSIDLYHFAQLMNIPESNAVKTAISNMLIKETHTAGGSVKNSNGMTIYFPTSTADYDSSYDNTLLAGATKWDEFISGKTNTYQASTTEPNDATCGAEANNGPSTAKTISSGTCTGYIYTAGDVDFYRFSIPNASLPTGALDTTKKLNVSLTNIPAGANFDVYVFAPFYSPSSAIAVGAAASSNGDETFSIELATGKVTFTAPNLSAYNGGVCDPGSTSDTLAQYGLCYGQGMVQNGSAHNIYVAVIGKNNSYSQLGKYSLTVTGTNVTINAPVAND